VTHVASIDTLPIFVDRPTGVILRSPILPLDFMFVTRNPCMPVDSHLPLNPSVPIWSMHAVVSPAVSRMIYLLKITTLSHRLIIKSFKC